MSYTVKHQSLFLISHYLKSENDLTPIFAYYGDDVKTLIQSWDKFKSTEKDEFGGIMYNLAEGTFGPETAVEIRNAMNNVIEMLTIGSTMVSEWNLITVRPSISQHILKVWKNAIYHNWRAL